MTRTQDSPDFLTATRDFHDTVVPWGHPVALGFRRRCPAGMARLPADAGFTLVFRAVREPDGTLGKGVARVAQAFLEVVEPV
ncbi:hypothetical protein ACPCBC_19075 [Streptomyces incarnatus]|nr:MULTISPECIES: hypothetical protein [Streptomyces]